MVGLGAFETTDGAGRLGWLVCDAMGAVGHVEGFVISWWTV